MHSLTGAAHRANSAIKWITTSHEEKPNTVEDVQRKVSMYRNIARPV